MLSQLRDARLNAYDVLDSNQLVTWIMSQAVRNIDRPCMAGLDQPVFHTLGEAVAGINERLMEHLKTPRGQYYSHLSEEKKMVSHIDHVRRRLVTLEYILSRQKDVWRICKAQGIPRSHEEADKTFRTISVAAQTDLDFESFERRVNRISADAERIEQCIVLNLDLNSKHATLTEALKQRFLNRAIIGFTVVTIFFTPLSFMSSLFALENKTKVSFIWPTSEYKTFVNKALFQRLSQLW